VVAEYLVVVAIGGGRDAGLKTGALIAAMGRIDRAWIRGSHREVVGDPSPKRTCRSAILG